VDNGVLWNKWFILDTDNGRNLQALIRGRASVGTSIRGLGSMSRLNHVENYQYLGTDAVGNPAAGTYALPGVEGVKVEVCESVIKEEHTFSKIYGYEVHGNSPENTLFVHPSGHVVNYKKSTGEYEFYNNDGSSKNFMHHVNLYQHLQKIHSKKESAMFPKHGDDSDFRGYKDRGQDGPYKGVEDHVNAYKAWVKSKGHLTHNASSVLADFIKDTGRPKSHYNMIANHLGFNESVILNGVGEVSVGTVLQYKGLKWKVENIQTSDDQWKMTLVNTTNSMMNTWLRSEDIPNPASQMVIIAESKGNVMSKVQNYLDKINEAASKLADITQKSNSKHDQLKFISMFESDLSNAKDLSGEELKGVLEQWESLKVEACKPKPASTIDDQMSQLKGTVSELTSLVHQVLNNKLTKVNEEEQKQIAVMRQFYSFDDRKIREALSAYTAHKDDPRSFAEELTSRLGVQVGGVNLGQLFDDLTDAAGDYQHTGLPAVAQNLVTSEELQSENAEYEALLDEFVAKIDSGELLSKEFVVEQMVKVITESRNTIRRHQVREALAVEVAVETIIKSTLNSKKLAESNKQNAQLVEALTVIINNLRESLLKKEGKIIATDYTKDKKTFIPGRITR
jgi:hypothetical protein